MRSEAPCLCKSLVLRVGRCFLPALTWSFRKLWQLSSLVKALSSRGPHPRARSGMNLAERLYENLKMGQLTRQPRQTHTGSPVAPGQTQRFWSLTRRSVPGGVTVTGRTEGEPSHDSQILL